MSPSDGPLSSSSPLPAPPRSFSALFPSIPSLWPSFSAIGKWYLAFQENHSLFFLFF